MNVLTSLLLGLWVGVFHQAGDPKEAGVIAPLQVAGVAAGTSVLVAGGAAIAAYGLYGWIGQSLAAADACGAVTAAPAPVSTEIAPAKAADAVPAPAQLAPPEGVPSTDTAPAP